MTRKIMVKKGSGEIEPFNPDKVRSAAIRSGASPDLADKIVANVRNRISSGVTTKQIYRLVFSMLRKEDERAASRFGLKTALLKLGPAGFPFETFFAEVLREHGYATKLRQTLEGAAINHEIDVIATKEKTFMIECKYHNIASLRCRSPDILYTYARFLDLVEGSKKGKGLKVDAPWLATNTKFSSDVIKYAAYKRMPLTGWGYPKENSLQKLIESRLLYPITILRSLDKFAKTRLSDCNMMLVKDLLSNSEKDLLSKTGIPRKTMNALIEEASVLVPEDELNDIRR